MLNVGFIVLNKDFKHQSNWISKPDMYVTGFDTPFSAASSSIPAGGLALQQKKGADRLDAAASSTAHTTVSGLSEKIC